MQEILMEYLVTFAKKDDFCKDIEGFNNLLQSIDGLKCKKDHIIYKNIKIQYNNTISLSEESSNRLFHITFKYSLEEDLSIFEKFIKDVRVLFLNTSHNREVITLYNGISGYYGAKAYPLIYRIENLMRKLLTQFMFVNIGEDWKENNMPDHLEGKIERNKDQNSCDYLYQIDFIHLSNFLFDKPRNKCKEELFQKLETDPLELMGEDLTRYIPRSNWEKYFEEIVDCDGEILKQKWKRLYDLRCSVAHNRFIDRAKYQELQKIIEFVEPILLKAIRKLEIVKVNYNEKQELNEELISSFDYLFGNFLKTYNSFEKCLVMYCNQNEREDIVNLYKAIVFLKENLDICDVDYEYISDIIKCRNIIVHKEPLDLAIYAQIDTYIIYMEKLTSQFSRELADTIVVPAQREGFKEVFIGENCWYAIRIAESMWSKLKYIAVYQVAPVSAITYLAEIEKIEKYKDTDKCIVYFRDKAHPIPPIKLVEARNALQSARYVNHQKLLKSVTIEQLFDKENEEVM